MAKYKREVIGSIIKSKTKGEPDYLKVKKDVFLKANQSLKLESKQTKLASLEQNLAAGRISVDTANAVREKIEQMPDFVRFEVVQIERTEA